VWWNHSRRRRMVHQSLIARIQRMKYELRENIRGNDPKLRWRTFEAGLG